MNIYGQTPYTYLLYCKPIDKIYYGVRVGNRLPPEEDLWRVYFSSSKHVKALRKQYGDGAFIATVRKTFTTRETAFAWEEKVLKRLFRAQRNRLINVKIPNSTFCNTLGYKQTPEHVQKRTQTMMDTRNSLPKKAMLEETKTKISAAAKQMWQDTKKREALVQRNVDRWKDPTEKERHIFLKSKTYRVILPTGEERVIRNLTKFAEDNSIDINTLQRAKRLNKPVKGFLVTLV